MAPRSAEQPFAEQGRWGQTILVVDDNPDVRDIFRLILTSEGYTVLTAVNGGEAVTLCQGLRLDLIFMDLIMPQVSGWDAIAQIRDKVGCETTPVLAMSAADLDRSRIQAAGFCALLRKPILPRDLLVAVRMCLDEGAADQGWIADLAKKLQDWGSEA